MARRGIAAALAAAFAAAGVGPAAAQTVPVVAIPGVEVIGTTPLPGLGTPVGPIGLTARYSYVSATYLTGFVENSPNNSTADADGNITVSPGDSLPGIPRQLLKLRASRAAGPGIATGATPAAASRQYARGNENNLDPGGIVPGCAVVNLDAQWRFDREWEIFGTVTNLFNTRYQNFGMLGANSFRGPGNAFAPALAGPEAFRTPAAAAGARLGVRYRFESARG